MSRLEKYFAAQFSGTVEEAKKIRDLCLSAQRSLNEIEEILSGLELTDGHRTSLKGAMRANDDINFFLVDPIEAKYPELKDDGSG